MIDQQIIKEIKTAVHKPLNWQHYESTSVCDYTNCFAHAIGSTGITNYSNFFEAYRLGMISSKKQKGERYCSKQEVRELFLSDVAILGLEIEEIPFENKWSFFQKFPNIQLDENQHLVALFVKINRKQIQDFHFLRYDKEKGWSEKRWFHRPNMLKEIFKEWPDDYSIVGVFKVTR